MFRAETKYDAKTHEAIMTNLYQYGEFVFAAAGHVRTDELIKRYRWSLKGKVRHEASVKK